MEKYAIYEDIAKRTGGDIYVGVVGPVRTGKSTLITKVMENLILPYSPEGLDKKIARDEMPQAAGGTAVMTTKPQFVPANAVKIKLKENSYANVRLIDCVGFMVDGADGGEKDGKPRLVKTPWSDTEMPFEAAAEIGTEKVIAEYSTVGILVTTDGTIGEIKRESYVPAEEKTAAELLLLKKPFVIVLNSKEPGSETAVKLKNSLEEKYGVPVVLMNAEAATADDIEEVFKKILYEFPMSEISVTLPKFLQALPESSPIIKNIVETVKTASADVVKAKDFYKINEAFPDGGNVFIDGLKEMDLSTGSAVYETGVKEGYFYEVLSETCGETLTDEYDVMSYVETLSEANRQYRKIRNALMSAEETGYGIVEPDESEITLYEPELYGKGGQYGVKFKATADSLHIMKIGVSATVSPVVGGKEQSEELEKELKSDYSENPKKILSTNIFGKELGDLIMDGLKRKASNMDVNSQGKMRKTVTRMVNEGKGGVICIIL